MGYQLMPPAHLTQPHGHARTTSKSRGISVTALYENQNVPFAEHGSVQTTKIIVLCCIIKACCVRCKQFGKLRKE